MNLLEKGFSIILNNNLEILWISEDFSLYLGYHTDELIGEPVSKIVETDIKSKVDIPKFFGMIKDSSNHLSTGIFNLSRIYSRDGSPEGYILQFYFQERETEDEDFLVFNTQNIKMKKLLEKASLIAYSDVSVLISGETGTGKSKLAKWIHINSNRVSFPFVSVNCSAIPETLFESEFFGYEKGAFTGATTSKPGKVEIADNGTLFLDEIGDLSLTSQAKLLVFVDTKEFERLGSSRPKKVNVRIISATNKNLLQSIKKGDFRSDLYYRIAITRIEIPPLRERKEDIPLIVNSYLHRKGKRITQRAMDFLMEHEWYGNIRELRAVLESACIMAYDRDVIDIQHISDEFLTFEEIYTDTTEFEPKLSEDKMFSEKERIKEALRKSSGNRKKAAEMLGISVTTLWRKMKKYNLVGEIS
ncbi:MAG TPA: sigma-54-dependent Fis family transcriptional regulator [Persephonella sp.]|uniref:AAA family ATPase n=1 Tax=Persephonella marina (strain DSM 14350 / EX-H1) TaxID=123214 RepID=C0QSE6_PERMH|nr:MULTISPECIES: sigma 54-interacting transcriptional regulator [Persephonella]ACO04840.1 AAA family ATPase [Persephonella marina EX-H1]HCB69340.1 sigma-54-dependent Fis family transcriptional regulator [Persephonella sp.]